MARDGVVELDGADFLPALVDQLLDAARDEDVALLVDAALVAGAEEAILGEGGRVGRRVVQVALGDVLAADADLGLAAHGHLLAGVVQDLDLDALADADARGLALSGRERVRGHLVRGFGHGVGFEDRRVVRLFQRVEGGRGEWGGAGSDEADLGLGVGRGVLEEDLVDGGDRRVPIGLVGDEVVPEFRGRELGRDNDRPAGVEGRQEACEEAVDVEERHDEHGAVRGRQIICGLDVLHGPGEVSVRQWHRLRSPCGPARVEDERDIIGLCLLDLLVPPSPELPLILDIEDDLATIPIALRNRSLVFPRSAHRGAVLLERAFWHQRNGRAQVIDVELEFLLLVCRVERGRDGSLPCGGQESDYEFIGVGERN